MSQESSLSELDLDALLELREDTLFWDTGDPALKAIDAEIERRGIRPSVQADAANSPSVTNLAGSTREYHNVGASVGGEPCENHNSNASGCSSQAAPKPSYPPSPSQSTQSTEPPSNGTAVYYGSHVPQSGGVKSDPFFDDVADDGLENAKKRSRAETRRAIETYLHCEGTRRFTLSKAIAGVKSNPVMASRTDKEMGWLLSYWLRLLKQLAPGYDVSVATNTKDFRELWLVTPAASDFLHEKFTHLDFTGKTDVQAIRMICAELSRRNGGKKFFLGCICLANEMTRLGFKMSKATANRRLKAMLEVGELIDPNKDDPTYIKPGSGNRKAREYVLGTTPNT